MGFLNDADVSKINKKLLKRTLFVTKRDRGLLKHQFDIVNVIVAMNAYLL